MSIKKYLIALSIAVMLTNVAEAQTKIGVVNFKTLFDGYHKTEQASASLDELAREFMEQRQDLFDQYEQALLEHQNLLDQADDQTISADERERIMQEAGQKLQEIQALEQEILDHESVAQETLAETTKQLRDDIIREIREQIDEMARAEGFMLVLNGAAEETNGIPNVLFTDGSVFHDVTNDVLTALNASELHIGVTEGKIELSWDNGQLQSTTQIDGGWDNVVGAMSPYKIEPSEGAGFFRLQLQ